MIELINLDNNLDIVSELQVLKLLLELNLDKRLDIVSK
jgi:hypothetical protein